MVYFTTTNDSKCPSFDVSIPEVFDIRKAAEQRVCLEIAKQLVDGSHEEELRYIRDNGGCKRFCDYGWLMKQINENQWFKGEYRDDCFDWVIRPFSRSDTPPQPGWEEKFWRENEIDERVQDSDADANADTDANKT